MKTVYVISSTDQWHSKDSYNTIAVCTNIHKAIHCIKEHAFDNDEKLTDEDVKNLLNINQTQGKDINYVIFKFTLNELLT